MDEELKATLRSRLEEDQTRLQIEVKDLRDYAVKATTYLEDEDGGHDSHIADGASSLVERQTDMTLLRNLERELTDTQQALSRMDSGSYGTCEVCEKPIAERRLQARPAASTCIDCQSEIEGRRRREASVQLSDE